MARRIIDSDDYRGAGVEPLFFPGGEPHVKLPDTLRGDVLLYLKLRTWSDVGFAACLTDALLRNERITGISAFIPYVPGARQDRSDGLAPLTSSIVARLIGHRRLVIRSFDIHSEAAKTPWVAVNNFMPADLRVPIHDDVVGIIAPDAGAIARANSFRNAFYPDAPVVNCSKRRDPISGQLSGYVMPPLPQAGRYIIVDDICDGGGTFNLLAGEFAKDRLADKCDLELFVSHGIFSKGLAAIDARISSITTTDSFCRPEVSIWKRRLEILPLYPLLAKMPGNDNA